MLEIVSSLKFSQLLNQATTESLITVEADGTVSVRDGAATYLKEITLGLPSVLYASSSLNFTPANTAQSLNLAVQTAGNIFAAPAAVNGSPSFRALVASDIPGLDASKIISGTFSDTFISSAAVWNAKQDALVSGTNIKTVGGQTILGSGDITLASLNYWTKTGFVLSYESTDNATGKATFNGGFEIYSTAPNHSLKQRVTMQTWRTQIGANTGAAGGSYYSIFNVTGGNHGLTVTTDGNVAIGTLPTSESSSNSRLYVYGGATGANIDVRGLDVAFKDQATLELQGSEYSTAYSSTRLQHRGANYGTSVSILGLVTQNFGELTFQEVSGAVIRSTNTTPILVGINNLEVARFLVGGFKVTGSIEYSTTLKPNGNAGTSGYFLKTTGTTNSWSAITLADISDYSAANINYWTLAGGNVFRTTGKVFVGHSADLGAYSFQVTGDTVLGGKLNIGNVQNPSNYLEVYGGANFRYPSSDNNAMYVRMGTYITNGLYGTFLKSDSYYSSTAITNLHLGITDGSGTDKILITLKGSNNFVGINTVTPTERLHVNGNLLVQLRYASTEIGDIKIEQESANQKSKLSYYWYGNETASMKFNRGGDGSGSSISFWTQLEGAATTEKIWINSRGNLGVGANSGSTKFGAYQSGSLGLFEFGSGGASTTLINQDTIIFNSGAGSASKAVFYNGSTYLLGITYIFEYGAAGTGFLALAPGSVSTSGYIGFSKSTGARLGYIGFDNTDLTYVSEGTANHVFLGNKIIIGAGGVNGSKIFQINGGIRQNDVISGLVYADSLGQFVSAEASHITATLGDGYIKNQSSYDQVASFRINGTGIFAHSSPIRFDNAGNQDIHSNNGGTVRFINSAYSYANVSFYQNGDVYIRNNVAIAAGLSSNARLRIDVPENYYAFEFVKAGASLGGMHFNDNIFNIGLLGAATTMDINIGGGSRMRFVSNGNIIIGNTSEYDNVKFQVNGSILQRGFLSGIAYSNASGTLVAASQANIMDVLGESAYIKNQYNNAQNANAWISGDFRANGFVKAGRKGFYGSYDYTEVQGIWSISEGYGISTANNDFGSQYGIVYGYEYGTTGTSKRPLTGYSHQILFVGNGVVYSAISMDTGKAFFNGYVGVGLSDAQYYLDSVGSIRLRNQSQIYFDTPSGASSNYIGITNSYWTTIYAGRGTTSRIDLTNANGILFSTNTYERFRVEVDGKVLINTSSAFNGSVLQVNGSILQRNVIATSIVKVLAADSNGTIVEADQAAVMGVLGDSAYIKNQNGSIQTGHFRISGTGRAPEFYADAVGGALYAAYGWLRNSYTQFYLYTYGNANNDLRLARYNDVGGYVGNVFIVYRNTGHVYFDNNVKIGGGEGSSSYNLDVAYTFRVGAQGGADFTAIGGGSGVGSFLSMYYADGNINNSLTGNGNNSLSAYVGSTVIGGLVSSNGAKLLVRGATSGYSAAGPSSNRSVQISNYDTAYGLHFGVYGSGAAWIQSGRADSTQTYDLWLQHEGSSVIVGNTYSVGGYKLQVHGDIWSNGYVYLRQSNPTILFNDTDHRGGAIHVNSNIFYVLRLDDAGTSWQANVNASTPWANGKWPFEIELETNYARFGGQVGQSFVYNSLVYANGGGTLVNATAQNVKDLLGDGAYIKNQFANAQAGAYFWIEQYARVGGYSTTGSTPRFSVTGDHSTTNFSLYSIGNGAGNDSSLDMWASEPNVTYDGCGIGHNINNHPYGGRRNTAKAQSYIRFYNGHIFFSSSIDQRTNPYNSPMILSNTERLLVGYGADINTYKVQINSGSATDNGLYVNGHIRATGNIIADGYFSGTASDRRYKSEFRPITVIDKIDKIDVSSYQHKLYGRRMIGSIAQDIEQLFPELVYQDDNKMYRLYDNGYAAIALQLGKEVKSEVDKLKERVQELEKQVEYLSK
jgi:hypothetical protein